MTELQPISDRIVVEPIEDATKTAGGLFIPDAVVKSNTAQAKIISMGGGALLSSGNRVTPEVSVGDIVLYTRMAGVDIKLDGKTYKIITERDIIGIIKE